jgi:hypothetical protein
LRHTNSPPHGPETASPVVFSYDSYCSFVVNQVKRAITLFPEEEWLHTLLASVEGQIPADHINGHGLDCQKIWQAVYFACRAHFHGETAEMLWAFLNPLGSSTRQMTRAARHDIINFVIHAWNVWKILRQGKLHRLELRRIADATDIWQRSFWLLSDSTPFGCSSCIWLCWRISAGRTQQKSVLGQECRESLRSQPMAKFKVFISTNQHKVRLDWIWMLIWAERLLVMTVESMLATMIAAEQEKSRCNDGHDAGTPIAQWIHDGMSIERSQ